MTQKKKNNIIIGSLCAVVLLMAVGYAAFSSILNIKGTSSISSNWKVLITNVVSKNIVGSASNKEEPSWEDLTATFKTNLVSPGDSIEYDITIENRGNLNAKLDKITLTDSNNEAIKFTSSGLEEGTELNAGGTATLTVKIEYDNNVTSQPENTEGTFTVTLDYSQKEGSGVVSQTAAEMLIATATDSGDGLYADEYEPGRYVYKGANPNNYITFNNEPWRIISVEADGSLKLIKMNKVANMAFDSQDNRNTGYCGLGNAIYFGCNAWAKSSNLVNGSLSGAVDKDSEVNTYLNTTYYNSLSNDIKDLIISHSFAVGPVEVFNDNLTNQISSEKSIIWNGKVGMITFSDFLRANSNKNQCGNFSLIGDNSEVCASTNYLLSLPKESNVWMISPSYNSEYDGFIVSEFEDEGGYGAKNINDILPIVYIKSDITLSGSGTSAEEYTIN